MVILEQVTAFGVTQARMIRCKLPLIERLGKIILVILHLLKCLISATSPVRAVLRTFMITKVGQVEHHSCMILIAFIAFDVVITASIEVSLLILEKQAIEGAPIT